MKKHKPMWITKAAAMAALVGGLGGVARATILSAGGFPGATLSTGVAKCAITNAGTRDVTVNSMRLLDNVGNILATQGASFLVAPGQTGVSYPADLATSSPSACIFDVSTKTGVRAAFVYTNGSAVTVIPAQK